MSDLDKVIHKAQTALLTHSDSHDISSLSVLMLFIVILTLVLIGAVTIRYGFHSKYLYFIGIIVLLFVNYRIRMGSATALNLTRANYKTVDPQDKKTFAAGILVYLSTGIGIKVVRNSVVCLFFQILVPLAMICCYEFFFGFMSIKRLLISLLILYPINFVIWKAYFSNEKLEYELLKSEYERDYNEVAASSYSE